MMPSTPDAMRCSIIAAKPSRSIDKAAWKGVATGGMMPVNRISCSSSGVAYAAGGCERRRCKEGLGDFPLALLCRSPIGFVLQLFGSDVHLHGFPRQLMVLGCQTDHGSLVPRGYCFDKLVMVPRRHRQVSLHSIIGWMEERATDPSMIDLQPFVAGHQESTVRHLTDDGVKALVLEVHRFAVTSLNGSAKVLLTMPEFCELARRRVLYGKTSDSFVDHRRDEEVVAERCQCHRDHAGTTVFPNDNVAFSR